jgi:Gpi18-like mannosyltransferase
MWLRWLHRDAIKYYILFALLYLGFLFVLPDAGYDKYFWITWTQDILNNGLGNVYLKPEVDNHPLILLLLKVFSLFQRNADAIGLSSVNWLKTLVLPFDFLTLIVVIHVLKRTNKPMMGFFVFFLNPAYWYNTVIWGQVDTIHTFFALAALIYAERGHWKWALVLMLVAVNFKLQAIIFFPLVAVLSLPFIRQKGWKYFGVQALVLIGIQTIILSPFIFSGNVSETINALLTRSVDQYPVLSRNAYNVWYYMVNDPFNFPDTYAVFHIPLKYWGIAMFFAASGMVMLPLFLAVNNGAFENLKGNERLGTIFQVAALVTIAFFMFNTQMHERYVHPAVLFSGLFMVLTHRPIVYLLVSIGYLLNMEAVMQFLRYFDGLVGVNFDHTEWLIFVPELIATLFLVAFLWGSLEFYRTFFSFKNNVPQEIITT